jgi:hypothetical protein
MNVFTRDNNALLGGSLVVTINGTFFVLRYHILSRLLTHKCSNMETKLSGIK